MRLRFLFLLVMIGTVAEASSLPPLLPNYGAGILNTAATPGSYQGALGSYWNPAGWAAMSRSEAAFTWDDRNSARKRLDNWGLHVGGHGLGASMRRTLVNVGDNIEHIDDFQLALAGGSRADHWGVSYGWSKGPAAGDMRQQHVTLGNVIRPFKYVSIGSAWTFGLRNGRAQMQADLGLRPIGGSHRLTLFADLAAHDKDNPRTMQWGAGVEVMPLDGIRIAGKIAKIDPVDPAPVFTLGIGFSVDATSFHLTPHYDKDSELQYTSYAIRVGRVEPSFEAEQYIERNQHIVAVGMRGDLVYQKARWFDEGRHTLMEMYQLIDEAQANRAVNGIALNLSGFNAPRALCWELAEKLRTFRESGKRVYMWIDRGGMTQIYLLTQADYVWMDPLGMLESAGWLTGKTYYHGMLEKLGIGAEEWRYFEYKSAFESLARNDMSEKDREQRMVLLEDFHREWSRAVTAEMGISADSIRLAMDSLGFLTAHEAERFGLVDTLGRWDDAKEILERATGKKAEFIERDELAEDKQSDPHWGEYPRVAVVYAVGECDLDSGIRGRYTSRLLQRLAKDRDIEAVVLRVDSPGGDGLASDWVADGMRDVSAEKPMIVSQGRVAASGGYWLSSPADYVFTSPFTVTGSIGVIAGFLWNEKLTEKTGLHYDKVQLGKHADLGAGVVLPLLNAEVPDRPITDEERARVEKLIIGHYDDFVGRVAEDRDMKREDVEAIAQGRVWSGPAALERKLVDEIGSLESSIDYARKSAGLSPRGKVTVVEYPKPGLLNLGRLFAPSSPVSMLASRLGLLPGEVVSHAEPSYGLKVLETYAKHPCQPLFMLPPEDDVNEK